MYRLAQTLNVFWEKTPESVLYSAVQAAVDSIDDLQLMDFTSTESVSLSHLHGKYLIQCRDVVETFVWRQRQPSRQQTS